MIRSVLLLGNPALRGICEAVMDFEDAQFLMEIDDLRNTLDDFRKRNGFGRGIAAVQIGILKRVVALNLGHDTFFIINPVITYRSKDLISLWDDCMSFPDFVVRVSRSKNISITYQNEGGDFVQWDDIPTAESELLQHEIDHLDGTLAIDRAISKTDIVYKSEYEKYKEFYEGSVSYSIKPTP